jgi:hypothetical protein
MFMRTDADRAMNLAISGFLSDFENVNLLAT